MFVALVAGSISVTIQAIRSDMVLAIFDNDSPEQVYQGKVEYLANEIVRVKKYETELKSRVDSLNTVINEAKGLEYVPKQDSSANDITAWRKKLGVGGNEKDAGSFLDGFGLAGIARRFSNKAPAEDNIISHADENINQLRSLPIGAPCQGDIASGYGIRRSPFSRILQMHTGLDLANDSNTPVHATAEGTATLVGWDGAYGLSVIISHGNGVETRYAHLNRTTVKEGQKISRGEQVGLMGSTGRSTGNHLHYEVMVNGQTKDPLRFVEIATFLKDLDSDS